MNTFLAHRKLEHGFSLIELMVTLAVAAILLSIGVPSFSALIENQRMTTTVNNLFAAINLTRAEALQRGVRVDLAPLKDKKWENGWAVFIDNNADQVPDFDTDEIVYSTGPIADGISITTNFHGGENIAYAGTGHLRTQAGTFSFVQGTEETLKKTLILNFIGRPRVYNVSE